MKVELSIIYNYEQKVTKFTALNITFLEAISEATPIGTNTMLSTRNITTTEKESNAFQYTYSHKQ